MLCLENGGGKLLDLNRLGKICCQVDEKCFGSLQTDQIGKERKAVFADACDAEKIHMQTRIDGEY